MLSLKEAKEFCRIDNDDEDTLIKTLINTADSYIAEACGENYNKDSEKAKLCQAMLGNKKALRYSVESLMLQLRYGTESSDAND